MVQQAAAASQHIQEHKPASGPIQNQRQELEDVKAVQKDAAPSNDSPKIENMAGSDEKQFTMNDSQDVMDAASVPLTATQD